MKPNLIAEKSFTFSEEIVEIYNKLIYSEKEYVLSKQLLRSGTSVGANVSEAVFGQSPKDFISKLSIARKEVNETLFLIRLMNRTGFVNSQDAKQLIVNCEEIIRILTASIKTSQERHPHL